MMAHKICCVPGCGKSRSDDVTLHMFPDPVNDADRFRTWLYTIGGDILNLDNQKIYKYRKVCDRHFEEKYHTRSKRLSAIAIPTLYVPGFCFAGQSRDSTEVPVTSAITSGIEDSSFNEKINVLTQEVQIQQPIICTESWKRKLLGDITNNPSTNPKPSTSAGMKDASIMKSDNVQVNVRSVTQQTKTSSSVSMTNSQLPCSFMPKKGILPEEAKETAEVLIFFDDLFDSVNGSFENSKQRSGKILLHAVTPNSTHLKPWKEARIQLKNMKFV